MKISKQTTYYCDTIEDVWVQIEDDGSVTLFGLDNSGYDLPSLMEISMFLQKVYNLLCNPMSEFFFDGDWDDDEEVPF